MRNLIIPLLFVGAFAAGCGSESTEPTGAEGLNIDAQAVAPTPAEIDRELALVVASADTVEARQWLAPAHTRHVLWKTWDKPAARRQVDALYAAGATRVYVVDPVEMDGTRVAAQFVVELPAAGPARDRVFQWIGKWEQDIDDGAPTKDVGQRFYEINLDL